ncbi:MAG TPA: phytanoyl-CoA dioxygenase family protein [Pseudomonadales bacterium]|nr:phytanoyl-CoA dioxygenase family protein [Pseudomonadales bacterium]
MNRISDSQWEHFEREGYVLLGNVATGDTLAGLQQRIDEIMLGNAGVDYQRMLMQLDSADGVYESAGEQTRGFKGERLDYRKIEQLENDALFLAYMQHPVFEDAARRVYGDVPISAFRAMMMNKPARRGTQLPLHQDRWRALDRDPLLTIYTALDAADETNGCVEIIPRTHHTLLNPQHGSGFLTAEMAACYDDHPDRMPLRLQAGEVALLHNWTLHASGINSTNRPRRAFSVCLMEAATVNLRYGQPAARSIIFGEGALLPENCRSA